jgi:hypothetical protein
MLEKGTEIQTRKRRRKNDMKDRIEERTRNRNRVIIEEKYTSKERWTAKKVTGS